MPPKVVDQTRALPEMTVIQMVFLWRPVTQFPEVYHAELNDRGETADPPSGWQTIRTSDSYLPRHDASLR